jgi:hypothetical protein
VRKTLSFLNIFLLLSAGCKQPTDAVVAEAFHRKLYMSEVMSNVPFAASKEDSLLFMEQYANNWMVRQTLFAHAKKGLTQSEQNFATQIKQFEEQLLINAFLKKLSSDSTIFEVPKTELLDFITETKTDNAPVYIDMVQLNYIKISNPSKIYKQVKDIFFDEKNRVKAMQQLEQLCADSIEYFLDGRQWFYTEFIEKELPFSFSYFEFENKKDKLDIPLDDYRYLIHILDRKQQLQPKTTVIDRKVALTLLQQQKRNQHIVNIKDSLVKKAQNDTRVVMYPIVF